MRTKKSNAINLVRALILVLLQLRLRFQIQSTIRILAELEATDPRHILHFIVHQTIVALHICRIAVEIVMKFAGSS